MVGTERHRLGGSEETGGKDNGDIGVGGGIGRGVGRGSEQRLGRRGGISGSERVEWSGMEWVGQVIHQDRRQAGNTAGRDGVVAKT